MASNDDITDIRNCFQEIPLLGYWAAIKQTYMNMGFTDPMTDSQKIDEYAYISEQMHKFVSKKYNEIMQYEDDLNAMAEKVEDILERVEENSRDRKTLVYYMLRDDWLIQLHNIILLTIDDLRVEEEDYV